MLEVSVRPAIAADARSIATVHVESWRAAYKDLMPAEYLRDLSIEEREQAWARSLPVEVAKRKRTLVAERGGAIVASATVGPDPDGPATGCLLLMYALESAWGTGTGRALMRASRAALIDLGFDRTILWVLEKNERARRFYECDGWRPDGVSHVDAYGGTELAAVRYEALLVRAG